MTIYNFIKEYKQITRTENKDIFIKNHIKNTYVGIDKKINICNKIVKSANYIDIEGQKLYRSSSVVEFVLFELSIISLYTDIEVDFSNEIQNQFDALDELDLIDKITGFIDEKEYQKMKTILNMVKSDLYENERSLAGYMDKKIGFLDIITKPLSEMIAKVAESPKFKSIIEKVD